MNEIVMNSTVDHKEVDYYTRLAEAWWDKEGPFWPLHRLNQLRIHYIASRIYEYFCLDAGRKFPLTGLEVLDVGCGGGILSESMAQLGAKVTGIDVVEKNIQIARLHANSQYLDISYNLITVEELAASGKQYNIVLNMEVVEHVADFPAFMKDCVRLVNDDGVMFVATINRTFIAGLVAIIGAEYILRWLPRGTHRWSMFRKPAEIEALLAGSLHVDDLTGVKVNPFTRGMSLTGMTAVNYMMFCIRHRKGITSSC